MTATINPRFQIGDLVTIHKPADSDVEYDQTWVPDMDRLDGQTARIKHLSPETGCIRVEEHPQWALDPRWIEPTADIAAAVDFQTFVNYFCVEPPQPQVFNIGDRERASQHQQTPQPMQAETPQFFAGDWVTIHKPSNINMSPTWIPVMDAFDQITAQITAVEPHNGPVRTDKTQHFRLSPEWLRLATAPAKNPSRLFPELSPKFIPIEPDLGFLIRLRELLSAPIRTMAATERMATELHNTAAHLTEIAQSCLRIPDTAIAQAVKDLKAVFENHPQINVTNPTRTDQHRANSHIDVTLQNLILQPDCNPYPQINGGQIPKIAMPELAVRLYNNGVVTAHINGEHWGKVPHVFGTGRACLGDFQAPIADAIDSGDWITAICLLPHFFQQAANNDELGRNWITLVHPDFKDFNFPNDAEDECNEHCVFDADEDCIEHHSCREGGTTIFHNYRECAGKHGVWERDK
jgi:hypothetical protein